MTDSVRAWAGAQKLTYSEKADMLTSVPMFAMGGNHVFTDVVTGELAPGVEGSMANYDRITRSNNSTHHHRYAVAVCGVPESIAFAPRLFCIGDGMSASTRGSAEDSFQAPDEKVQLESEALRDRYEIWASSEIGRNWLVQLFSPGFIDWMINGTPKTFSFQLVDGAFCGYIEGEADGQMMDTLRRTVVEAARRIRAECHEEEGLAGAGREAIAWSPFSARVEQKIAGLTWAKPPPDAVTAITAYRKVARTMIRPYIDGLGTAIFVGVSAALWVDTGEWRSSLAIALVVGGLSGIALTRKEIGDRARRFGLESFAREYAKSRGLKSESARGFQARHMTLKIPGAAEQVVSGKLPGDIEGSLAFCRDKSNRRKPVDYNVLIADGEIVASEPAFRELRTAEKLDDFCARGAAKARAGTSSGTS